MIYHTKTMLYVCAVFSFALLLFSCEDSIVDPKEPPWEDPGPGPSDERILFVKYHGSISQICSIKPDGTDMDTIASVDNAGKFLREGYIDAQWSPDKSLIVLTGGPRESPEFSPIWIMDNDGNLLYRLTTDGGGPQWSSDGNEILFGRSRGYFSFLVDFYIFNINTLSERTAVRTDDVHSWAYPDWSTDGKYILTSEEAIYPNDEDVLINTDQELVVIELRTGTRIKLTDTEIQDRGAKWSPDESKIAYKSGGYVLGYQIKLMNSDGSGIETLVEPLELYTTINWSPDGNMIAFCKRERLEGHAEYADGSDIFVLDVNSGSIEQITNFADESIKVYLYDWK